MKKLQLQPISNTHVFPKDVAMTYKRHQATCMILSVCGFLHICATLRSQGDIWVLLYPSPFYAIDSPARLETSKLQESFCVHPS